MSKYDVYSYGMISASMLYTLKQPFPPADHYAEIDNLHQMIGGEAANSSIVLSALGLKVKIDGNWLSADERGNNTQKILNDFCIDTSRLKKKKGVSAPYEVVFSDNKSRTLFGNYSQLLTPKRLWNIPVKVDISSARVVCLDPFFNKESLLVAQYAKQKGVPYVTVDCQHSDKILQDASAVIIASEFKERFYKDDVEDLLMKYQKNTAGLVVFTSGQGEIIFGRKDCMPKSHFPARIKPVDTTGAGDAFRSGIIYGMIQEWSDERMVAFAAALAAQVCLRFPGVLNSPSTKEVLDFEKSCRENGTAPKRGRASCEDCKVVLH